jgi:hypothetical protein
MNRSDLEEAKRTQRPYSWRLSFISLYFRQPPLISPGGRRSMRDRGRGTGAVSGKTVGPLAKLSISETIAPHVSFLDTNKSPAKPTLKYQN